VAEHKVLGSNIAHDVGDACAAARLAWLAVLRRRAVEHLQ